MLARLIRTSFWPARSNLNGSPANIVGFLIILPSKQGSKSMKGLIIPLLVLVTPVTQAGAYRWVDANGQTHFGDRPPANAAPDKLELETAPLTLDAAANARKQ